MLNWDKNNWNSTMLKISNFRPPIFLLTKPKLSNERKNTASATRTTKSIALAAEDNNNPDSLYCVILRQNNNNISTSCLCKGCRRTTASSWRPLYAVWECEINEIPFTSSVPIRQIRLRSLQRYKPRSNCKCYGSGIIQSSIIHCLYVHMNVFSFWNPKRSHAQVCTKLHSAWHCISEHMHPWTLQGHWHG